MAPEALKSREYSEATDAFSFGVLLWEMMARKRPWGGAEAVQIITAVTTNTRLKIPKDCDPIFAHLMKLCWRQNPSQRPTFEKVADTLSSYYKKLHKLHDVNADAFEISDQEEESEDEMALEEEGMSYEEWQLKRIKDEVKSFMKQLITERNDDFELVAKANTVAFTELKEAFKGAQHSDDDDDEDDDDDGDDDDDDHGDGDDEGAHKQKIYLENEVLFAESGESGGSDVPASSANVRMPTITYAEIGRRDTTSPSSSVGAASAEAARASTPAPIPASQYAIVGVGSSSGRRGGGARTGEADGEADATPASHYFEVVRRNSQTPKTKSDQVPLPASQYAVLERRSPVQQQQRHQEEEVSRDEAPAKGAVSSAYQEVVVPQEQPTFDGAYFTLGKTEDRKGQTGYEEITVAPSGHPQDTGYYGL